MPMPNTVLPITDATAIHTVSQSAWRTSGSFQTSRRSVRPSAKAFFATSDTGQATRKNR